MSLKSERRYNTMMLTGAGAPGDSKFRCLDGCGMCCECIPLPETVYNLGMEQGHGQCKPTSVEHIGKIHPALPEEYVWPLTSDGQCIFINRESKRCEIYHTRPAICRVFGTIPCEPCPYRRTDGTDRTEHEVKHIKNMLMKRSNARLKEIGVGRKVPGEDQPYSWCTNEQITRLKPCKFDLCHNCPYNNGITPERAVASVLEASGNGAEPVTQKSWEIACQPPLDPTGL